MATTILILIVALFTIAVFPIIDKRSHTGLHNTDLMAGDEGLG